MSQTKTGREMSGADVDCSHSIVAAAHGLPSEIMVDKVVVFRTVLRMAVPLLSSRNNLPAQFFARLYNPSATRAAKLEIALKIAKCKTCQPSQRAKIDDVKVDPICF